MIRVEYLEHTADVGFEISADTLPELFAAAADSMFELLLGEPPARPPDLEHSAERRNIRLHAEDSALLLASWLRELLFLYEANALCPVHALFSLLTETELAATVSFRTPLSAPIREIKAVTYHQLYLRRENEGWRARVIFDV